MAVATSAKKKHGKKAPGGLQTLKISNNFGAPGRRNPPRAAKLNGGEIKLRTPRKRPVDGTPCKMAQGGEAKFPFRLDCERAYAALSVQASPPVVAAKYNDPDDQADQQPYGGHGKAGVPKVPTKGGRGLKVASSDEDDSDDDKIVRVGTTRPAVLRALAATKHGHGFELARIDGDDPVDDETASAGARKPAWLQASATATKLDGRISRTPLKKARGREAQFSFRLDRAREYATQSMKAKPPALATKHDKPDDLTAATERQNSPRHPPRAGTATRSQAAAKKARMAMRLHPWVQQNHRCSEPWRPLPSGARSA